jgi:hypothetical protein
MITAYIPRARLCFAEGATLAFHMPYVKETGAPSPDTARGMYNQYPAEIRGWIDAQGGPERLPRIGYWVLSAPELWEMGLPNCDLPVVADAPVPRPRPASATPAPVEHVAAAAPQYRAHPCPVISLLTLGVLCF